MDLSQYAGVFTDGYTPEDLASILPRLSADIGLDIACVWDYEDEHGAGGDSELCVVSDGAARELPEGLWELLRDGAITDITQVAGASHPEINLTMAIDYAHSGDHQYHMQYRNS